jgi:general secretion pathway protein C
MAGTAGSVWADDVSQDAGGGGIAQGLDYIVQGIIQLPGGLSRAIIVQPGEMERHVKAGEWLQPGVRLLSIAKDHVVLENQGRQERLPLPRAPKAFLVGEAPPVQRRARPPVVASPGSTTVHEQLRELRQLWMDSPSGFAARVRLIPLMAHDRLTGYRLASGSDVALLATFGLQIGDVVTDVNCTPLRNMSAIMALLGRLATTDELHLRVRRQDKIMHLDFYLDG